MKALAFLVCILLFSALSGTAVLRVSYGGQTNKFYMADRLITGLTVIVGMAESVHLGAVFAGYSFGKAVHFFAAECVFVGILSLGILLWMRHSRGKRQGTGQRAQNRSVCTPFLFGVTMVFVLMILYQIVTILSRDSVYRTGDMTAETVESFLQSDGVYQVNPLTGEAYEAGVPLRVQILCLPTLYAVFCRMSGQGAVELVWKQVPLFVLLMSYLAFHSLAGALWTKEEDREKRMLFMAIVSVLFSVGDYLYGMDGFGLLHCGCRGVTIRGTILLPYVFSLTLRHRWKTVLFCILAEACVVWTLYGMGSCLLAALGMGAVRIWQIHRNRGLRGAGKEV